MWFQMTLHPCSSQEKVNDVLVGCGDGAVFELGRRLPPVMTAGKLGGFPIYKVNCSSLSLSKQVQTLAVSYLYNMLKNNTVAQHLQ